MSAYLIALITVTDDAWVSSYLAEVPALVEKHGGAVPGRVVARAGESPGNAREGFSRFPVAAPPRCMQSSASVLECPIAPQRAWITDGCGRRKGGSRSLQ